MIASRLSGTNDVLKKRKRSSSPCLKDVHGNEIASAENFYHHLFVNKTTTLHTFPFKFFKKKSRNFASA